MNAGLMKYINLDRSTPNDGLINRLHYQFTRVIFLSCAVISLYRQITGEIIQCYNRGIDTATLNAVCYIQGTYIIPNKTTYDTVSKTDVRVYQSYYQFIPLYFMCAAVAFYLPHLVAKEFYNKKLAYFRLLLVEALFILQLASHFYLVFMFWLPDEFPSFTRCEFKSTGDSGDVNTKYAFCVLSLNVIYTIIFKCLRVWFWSLMVVSVVNYIYHLLLLSKAIRTLIYKESSKLSLHKWWWNFKYCK